MIRQESVQATQWRRDNQVRQHRGTSIEKQKVMQSRAGASCSRTVMVGQSNTRQGNPRRAGQGRAEKGRAQRARRPGREGTGCMNADAMTDWSADTAYAMSGMICRLKSCFATHHLETN